MMEDSVLFFPTPEAFRAWLEANHQQASELWVGYYKKKTGIPSMTWPESVDEALCYGWIDGLRKSIDEQRYKIRFSPRKAGSHWSAVNIERVGVLKKEGRMQPAGLEAFARRTEKNSRRAGYEQKSVALPPEYEAHIRAHPDAWAFFEALAPSYKKNSIWWVMQAKREETRQRRLRILIESSAEGKKIPPLRRN